AGFGGASSDGAASGHAAQVTNIANISLVASVCHGASCPAALGGRRGCWSMRDRKSAQRSRGTRFGLGYRSRRLLGDVQKHEQALRASVEHAEQPAPMVAAQLTQLALDL